jgi:hypothetical protein
MYFPFVVFPNSTIGETGAVGSTGMPKKRRRVSNDSSISKDKNGDEVAGSSVADGAENAPTTKKRRVAKNARLDDSSWDEYER